jgi:hypothetical protein
MPVFRGRAATFIELVHSNMVCVVAIIIVIIGGWIAWLQAVLFSNALSVEQIAVETMVPYTVCHPTELISMPAAA